jgi:FKBP-type peptidyl-prolyl cis-trans isomerase SlyD
VQRVLRSLLPIEGDVKPGDQFRAGSDAYAPIVTVRGIEGEELLLDANHPLAGVDLEFEVELLAVRAATAEEIEHGHAHGDGGCCGGQGHGECGGSGECSHEGHGHDHGDGHGHGEAKGECGKHDCGCKG